MNSRDMAISIFTRCHLISQCLKSYFDIFKVKNHLLKNNKILIEDSRNFVCFLAKVLVFSHLKGSMKMLILIMLKKIRNT